MKDDLIRQYSMLPQGSSVLCAVSGGADSMCLLCWLNELRPEYGFSLFAAHYEHGLRGEESLRDAEFTVEQCGRLGISCTVGHGDVSTYAGVHRLGLEDAARTLRYRFLEETADRLGCDRAREPEDWRGSRRSEAALSARCCRPLGKRSRDTLHGIISRMLKTAAMRPTRIQETASAISCSRCWYRKILPY